MEEIKYLYSINVRKPIPSLNIFKPKSMELTLEEVKECLPNASVFRWFTPNLLKKVTTGNCERYHNEKYMTKEEYKQFLINKAGDTGNVTDTRVEEKEPEKTEEIPVNDEEVIPEEVVKEEVSETQVEEKQEQRQQNFNKKNKKK